VSNSVYFMTVKRHQAPAFFTNFGIFCTITDVFSVLPWLPRENLMWFSVLYILQKSISEHFSVTSLYCKLLILDQIF